VRLDVLRELVRMARLSEPDDTNVGTFVAEHAAELAPLLHTHEAALTKAAGHADEIVLRALRRRIDNALVEERERRRDAGAAAAREAAVQVARTARWLELGVVVDVDVVLGKLLADPGSRHVAFALPDAIVAVEAPLLRRCRLLSRTYIDLAGFVDQDGIHFRWKGGKGALNLRSLILSASQLERALIVPIPPPMRPAMPALVGVIAGELAAY
jgi:ElaB/YqjD/DUF883 family membrane-anchored ribosome-binding protein